MKNQTLQAARKNSSKTQVQVAKEVEIAESAYKTYERGTRTPNVLTALKIAKVLDTTVENIWGSN